MAAANRVTDGAGNPVDEVKPGYKRSVATPIADYDRGMLHAVLAPFQGELIALSEKKRHALGGCNRKPLDAQRAAIQQMNIYLGTFTTRDKPSSFDANFEAFGQFIMEQLENKHIHDCAQTKDLFYRIAQAIETIYKGHIVTIDNTLCSRWDQALSATAPRPRCGFIWHPAASTAVTAATPLMGGR